MASNWAWSSGTCARPIIVAASPLGETMKINGQAVSGIIPDFLSKISLETGCQFSYDIVPRVRALMMFERGEVDVMDAVQTPARDTAGLFIPYFSFKNALITRKSRQTNVAPLVLLQQGQLQVNVLRGMNHGSEYLALLAQLRQQNRLEDVVDLNMIARKMELNRADATIVSPIIFLDAATRHGIADDLQITLLQTVPAKAGIYLSNKLLSEVDGQRIKSAISKAISEGNIWRMYQERLPAWSLTGVVPITGAR
ncbi:MAG: hypothetical protein ACRC6G_04360 [Deefgea sp.]